MSSELKSDWMGPLAECLKLLQETAQAAQEPQVLSELITDGRSVYIQQGLELKKIDLPPPVRNHQVQSLEDLIQYVRGRKVVDPVVWHGENRVILVPDDGDRRDQVVFPLTYSERFMALTSLRKSRPTFTQDKFVRLLRLDLDLDNLTVVSKFRRIDFSAGDQGTGTVEHGNQRLGKEISSKVTGTEDLPEELLVPTPVYQQLGEREEYPVRCAVEIDPVNRMFQLLPLADELERVISVAQVRIHQRLTAALGGSEGSKAVPVYYGSP